MTPALHAEGLGKRYGRRWALAGCDLDLPAGHVIGVVGSNGAGKSTLLGLAAGHLTPSAGELTVLGERPGANPAALARVAFVAQGTPTYAGFSVADHLRLGARLNPRWDGELAHEQISHLGLDPRRRAGNLSGGQRAQLALTLGLATRPELLLLDEPVAALDPVARRRFLQGLMEAVAEQDLTVVVSSHLVSDLERVCDRLVVLAGGRVLLEGDVDELLATHHRLTGPRRDAARLPGDQHVVAARHTARQTTVVVRTEGPILDRAWTVSALGLEDLVLAYLGEPAAAAPIAPGAGRPTLELQR